MTALDRKLVRDVYHLKGQVFAISLVIACGVATYVMSLSALHALQTTRQTYYERYRFSDVFANLKRAPNSLIPRLAAIEGVAVAETRVVTDVTLDVAGLAEPAVARLISIPERPLPGLNELYLRSGRYIEPERTGEVIASEAFVDAHGFGPGDTVIAVINGRKKQLKIVGVGLSPEYVFQLRGGELLPDDKRFGVFWMGRKALEAAYDMEGAFNDVTLTLMPGASEEEVIRRLDDLLEPYGGLGAFGREDQVSNRFLSDEMQQLEKMGTAVPAIFLAVAAFLLNVVLSRIVSLQRDQIAALKAFGYSNLAVGWHYLKLVIAIVTVGVILGTCAGTWLGMQITQLYTRFYRFPLLEFELPWSVVVGGWFLSTIAGLIGVMNVLRLVVRLPPAEAMRPESPPVYRKTILERLGLTRWLSQPARMVMRHLERRPVKACFSILGIAMAVSVLILGSFTADSIEYMLEIQFEVAQRQDLTVAFIEPTSEAGLNALRHLPGVTYAEGFRAVPCRLRYEQNVHRTAVQGFSNPSHLFLLIDQETLPVPMPPAGLVLNTKLASILGVKVGDIVRMEVLESSRVVRDVPVTGLTEEYMGANAYMDRAALNRLMQEGDVVSGAYLSADSAAIQDLYAELKETPRVASVTVKEASIRSFHEIIAENLLQMQAFNAMFASIIAFGVVYNTARVALSERGRELASLRVIGLTRTEISTILLGELAILTLLAIPLGLLIGYGMAYSVASSLDTEMYRIPMVVNPRTYAMAAVIVLIASVISGLVVRRRLDHLDLIAVLKTRE